MLTQVCAKEWGVDGIRVNYIAPGLIKTEFSRALWDNRAALKNSRAQSPLRRIGEPDEMAGTCLLRQRSLLVLRPDAHPGRWRPRIGRSGATPCQDMIVDLLGSLRSRRRPRR